jgi:hypothetical protein
MTFGLTFKGNLRYLLSESAEIYETVLFRRSAGRFLFYLIWQIISEPFYETSIKSQVEFSLYRWKNKQYGFVYEMGKKIIVRSLWQSMNRYEF